MGPQTSERPAQLKLETKRNYEKDEDKSNSNTNFGVNGRSV